MHRAFLLLYFAIFARAANPLLTKRQAGPNGAPSKQDLNSINNCLNPEGGIAPNVESTACKPKYVMDATGQCGPLTLHNECRAYCQVSVSWNYGLESQFPDTWCQQQDPVCTLSDTKTTAVTNSETFNVGIQLGTRSLDSRDDGPSLPALKATFSAGATWGWSDTYTNATAVASSRPPKTANKCGYWTFVPYMVTSCGSVSIGTWTTSSGAGTGYAGGGDSTASCQNIHTTGDWCQTVPMQDEQGTPLGETIFVAASCCGSWPIGWCYQQPIYNIEGVSNNASIYNDYVLSHENYDLSLPIESTDSITCLNGERPFNEDNGNCA